jgi:thioredoxin reductase
MALAKFTDRVTILYRGETFRASKNHAGKVFK